MRKTAKEFKGTKSEWKIQEPYNTFVYGSEGKLICQIKYDPFSEESLANARLIAAAPELLEALQLVFVHAKVIINENHSDYKKAVKAINKALGL